MVSFFSVIKADPVKYEKEKARVCQNENNMYANNEEYREARKLYAKQYRIKKQLEKQDKTI